MNISIYCRSSFRIGLLLIFSLFTIHSALADTYYIDPGAPSNGNGTIESPYNSWGAISSWIAGNTYLQKRGTVWNSTIRVGNSGSEGNYITLGSYGEGEKPKIETHNTPGFIITDRSYIKIKDFHIITTGQDRYWNTSGIYGNRGEYNVLEDLEIGPAAAHGVYLGANHNLVVRRCLFYNTGTKDEWDSCDNIHLENCHDYLVEFCISYNALQGAVYDASDGGNGYTTGTWRHNIGYRTPDSDTEHSNWSIYKLSGHSPQSKVRLINNIAYGSFNGPAYALQEELDAIAIGNIAYDCAAGFQQVPASNIIKNNIVMNCDQVIYFPDGNFPAEMDYNIFYNNNRFARGQGGALYQTLDDFKAVSNLNENSMVTDPMFKDAENYDFTLMTGSPAIDAGENVENDLGTLYVNGIDPFSSWPDNVTLLNQNDFGSGWEIGPFIYKPVTHIDPSATGNGDGSIDSPLNSWNAVQWNPNGVFLQKRGTTWEGNITIDAGGTANAPLIIGAYGKGNLPKVEATDTIAINLNGNDFIQIENIHVTTTGEDAHGIYAKNSENATLKELEISSAGGSGVYLESSHHATIQNASIHHADQDNIIILNTDEYLISSSEIHDAGEQSVQINGGSGTMEYSKIYNEGGWSLCMINSDVEIAYNIFYGAKSGSGPAIALQGGIAKVLNNTIYDATMGIYLQSPGHTVKNNIIAGSTIGIRTHIDEFPAVSDNNLFYDIENDRVVQLDEQAGSGESYKNYDLAAWKNLDAHDFDMNSLKGDPKFTNPDAGKFTIQPGSMAIDSGAVLDDHLTYALAGAASWPSNVKLTNQAAHGNGWEIGAYAYIPVYYNLEITENEGAVEPGSGMYPGGTSLTLTAIADAGFEFESWSGDVSATENPFTVVMDSNISITANFKALDIQPVVYEMEYGFAHKSLDEPLAIENRHAGFSGTGAVNTDNELGTWSAVIVYANEGTHDMKIRYALGGNANRPADVYVNGQLQIEALPFEILGAGEEGWKTWDYQNLRLDLNGGGDTIKFVASSDLGCANLDRLDVFQDRELNDTIMTQVESSFYNDYDAGSQVSSAETGFTGSGYLDVSDQNGAWWEQKVFVPATGNYSLGIRYANGNSGSSNANIKVNGMTEIEDLSFSATGDWNVWEYQTVTLQLEEGHNTMRFITDSENGSPHIDRLDILPGAEMFELFKLNILSANGQVTPAVREYKQGTEVTVTAVPDSGYKFINWSGDVNLEDNPVSVTMDSNITLTANYVRMFRLTTMAVNGKVDTTGGIFEENSEITLEALADSGFVFSGWSGDLKGSENPAEITLNDNQDITAHFVRVYKLSVSASHGMVSFTDSLNHMVSSMDTLIRSGEEVSLRALADTGYRFIQWEGNPGDTANPLVFTMNEDVSINAVFDVISGIYSINQDVDMQVYPNPFQDYIRIRIDQPENSGKYGIKIYDISGHEVLSRRIDNTERIPMSQLKEGMYLLRVFDDQGLMKHLKMIKRNNPK